VATDPTLDPRLITIWQFVRGDLDAGVFERWAYEHSDDLEGMFGKQDALYVLAADYRLTEAIALVKDTLRPHAARASSLRCRCVTLADTAVVDMGSDSSEVMASIEEKRWRGEPWWWLWCGECTRCGQWWLVAQEERQNDVFCLRRLDDADVRNLLETDAWPLYFDTYESLLQLGRGAGRIVRFVDPEGAVALRATVTELARARPGIRVSELASLLNLDIGVARALAQRAIRDDSVAIELDQG